MKPCPTCGAACPDEALFCEADGTKLAEAAEAAAAERREGNGPEQPEGAATDSAAASKDGTTSSSDPEPTERTEEFAAAEVVKSAPPSESSGVACSACGSTNTDDGDGYCRLCGHRLSRRAEGATDFSETTASSLRPGGIVGRFLLHSPTAADDARATAADGTEALIVVGEPSAIMAEAEALEELRGEPAFPRVIERGTAHPLAYLALTPPEASARKLIDVVQNESAAVAVKVIGALLDVAELLEKHDLTFQPATRDLLLAPDGTVRLCRLRSARRVKGSFDARRFLESLGEIFLPPALLGPTRLVRLLVPNRASADTQGRLIADIRAAIEAVEADLAEPAEPSHIAELCDPGLWRPYNQDATALAHGVTPSGEPFAVLVVCDGVSSSSFSEMASFIAARAARDALSHFARSPDIRHETAASAVAQAIRAAHLAICVAHVAQPVSDLPGTTIAAGLIYRRRLTVGWVGDSRCYWLTPRTAELLTHDHSWVNEAIARGEVKDAAEVQGALAHTITRCLGPLEVGDVPAEVEPDVRSRDLAGPGVVLFCTDGLWNYAPDPDDIARVLRVSPDETDAAGLARLFINYALARGGQDNVSVAVYAQNK